MRKTIALVILLVVAITLSITYAIIQAQQAPRWQIKLNNYVKYRNDTLYKDPLMSGTVTVERVTSASRPENFHQTGKKRLVVGDHYWLMENREALLSPPEEVRCVLLREDTRSNDGSKAEVTHNVLFVAYYSHPVEPEWLVYKGDNASAIGCELEWE